MLGDWPLDNKLPWANNFNSGSAYTHRLIRLRNIDLRLIGGHEGAGYIVAKNDDTSKLQVGQNVGIKWIASSCNVSLPPDSHMEQS